MTTPLHVRLAEALSRAGCTHLFGLPGGGPNLDVIGAAAANGIDFVLGHAEAEAAIQAAAHGLVAGVPTAVVATRGPGAASLVNGAAAATLDRLPLVLITDTVSSVHAHRVDHQRIDQRAMFAPVTKVSATITDGTTDEELDALIASAVTWPYGAVHLDYDPAGTSDAAMEHSDTSVAPSAALEEAAALVAAAQRPVVLIGAEAAADGAARGAIERANIPALSTYQAVGTISTTNELHGGLFTNGAIEQPLLDQADCIITLGLDLVEPIPAPWRYTAPVIRLSAVPSASEYMPVTVEVLGRLVDTVGTVLGTAGPERNWAPNTNAETQRAVRAVDLPAAPDSISPIELVDTVAAAAPRDATLTVDAGAHFLAAMPLWPVEAAHRLLISNGLATMGFALPAAIGAAISRPGEPAIAMTGDGGMSMVLAELETLARRQLPVTVVVFNDASLSLIKIKQGAAHGGEQAVGYRPVDYAAIGRASGIDGHVVKSVTSLRSQLETGWDRPRILDVHVDPETYPQLITLTRG